MKKTARYIVMAGALGLLVSVGLFAGAAHAQDTSKIKLIVPIPVTGGVQEDAPSNPGDYVKVIYQWAIGIAALLAMGELVLGGVQYVLAAGNPSLKHSADERMKSAVFGLIILLTIVIILVAINPGLVNISLPERGVIDLEHPAN